MVYSPCAFDGGSLLDNSGLGDNGCGVSTISVATDATVAESGAVAEAGTVATVAVDNTVTVVDGGHIGGLNDTWGLLDFRGSNLSSVDVLLGVSIVVLSPLVVVSTDLAGVLLIIVGGGVDHVVGLAPSGVLVTAVSLLGPRVVVVSASSGSFASGGSLVCLGVGGGLAVGAVAAIAAVATVATVPAIAAAVAATIAAIATVTTVITAAIAAIATVATVAPIATIAAVAIAIAAVATAIAAVAAAIAASIIAGISRVLLGSATLNAVSGLVNGLNTSVHPIDCSS